MRVARGGFCLMPLLGSGWTSRAKFAAVLDTAEMNEVDLAEYGRRPGVYPAQIKAWRLACDQANDWERTSTAKMSHATREWRKRIKERERELVRNDRALAETATLLVLRKKLPTIWGQDEDSSPPPQIAKLPPCRSKRPSPLARCAPKPAPCQKSVNGPCAAGREAVRFTPINAALFSAPSHSTNSAKMNVPLF
jgi:hypothetical protein